MPKCGPEPYAKRTAHGLILGEGGEKMSKSRGNVVNPNEVVEQYGADTLRVYEMFMVRSIKQFRGTRRVCPVCVDFWIVSGTSIPVN